MAVVIRNGRICTKCGALNLGCVRSCSKCGHVFSKYMNQKVRLDGYLFDSLKERDRYLELLLKQRIGEISGLTVHPKFDLNVDGKKICRFIPDFQYRVVCGGNVVVEDVKVNPTMTRAYRIKKKLMAALHGITIQEV